MSAPSKQRKCDAKQIGAHSPARHLTTTSHPSFHPRSAGKSPERRERYQRHRCSVLPYTVIFHDTLPLLRHPSAALAGKEVGYRPSSTGAHSNDLVRSDVIRIMLPARTRRFWYYEPIRFHHLRRAQSFSNSTKRGSLIQLIGWDRAIEATLLPRCSLNDFQSGLERAASNPGFGHDVCALRTSKNPSGRDKLGRRSRPNRLLHAKPGRQHFLGPIAERSEPIGMWLRWLREAAVGSKLTIQSWRRSGWDGALLLTRRWSRN